MKYKPSFDFAFCLQALEQQGRKHFGSKFRIHDIDHEVIYRLLTYFLRSPTDAAQLGIDLAKGVLLAGPVGCGKTSLMMLMNAIPGPHHNFIMRTCRDISFEFVDEGYAVISRYSRMSFRNLQPKTYCFDDLGSEQAIKYYGNECNIMGEIILSRYDQFTNNGMITHFTTNLSATSIQEFYGDRVRSRLRAQVNLVGFDPKSADKRA